MKKLGLLITVAIITYGCAPSQNSVQTAIAQTQSAWTPTPTLTPTATLTPIPTLTPTATAFPQSSNPTASNFYMASDSQGKDKTTTFSPNDAFFIFLNVSGVKGGTVFESKWYALNASGQDPKTPFKTMDLTYESGGLTIYFHLTNNGAWPTGNYKVDVYMNDIQIVEQQFSVR